MTTISIKFNVKKGTADGMEEIEKYIKYIRQGYEKSRASAPVLYGSLGSVTNLERRGDAWVVSVKAGDLAGASGKRYFYAQKSMVTGYPNGTPAFHHIEYGFGLGGSPRSGTRGNGVHRGSTKALDNWERKLNSTVKIPARLTK